jgi:hypothetical protein
MTSRREFCASLAAAAQASAAEPALDRQVGLVTASIAAHLKSAFDLPRILRDELDLRVIDLNHNVLPSNGRADLDKFRAAADRAGCTISNLKMNQRDINMDSPEAEVRDHAVDQYRQWIDAAAHLGCRWARPLPRPEKPDVKIHVDSYRRLAEHGERRGVQMIVENFAWMQDDADILPKLVRDIGRKVAAGPDTGNWNSNAVRYDGLAKAFPLAVTCDFKAKELTPEGTHPEYDLKRCFDIGWKAGFRGPWCLEYIHKDRATLIKNLGLLRDRLRGWMREAG